MILKSIGLDKNNESNTFQYLAALTGTLSVLVNGMQYGWTSPYLPQLMDENSYVKITNEEGSMIAIFILIGLGIGCATGGLLSDIIGRKSCALISGPLFITSASLTIFGWSVEFFYLSRFLAGIADGISFTSIPMYLGEVASPKIRGLLGSSVSFTFIFGIFLINLLGIYLTLQEAGIVLCVIPTIYLVSFSFMPESPYYFVKKNRLESARKSLQIFRGTENVEEELNEIHDAVKQQELYGKYKHLFTVESNRKALFIVIGLRSFQELSGITAFVFYTKIIFQQGAGNIPAEWCAVIFTAVQALFTMISSSIVDKTGRKPLLIVSAFGASLALISEGVYFLCRDEYDLISSDYNWISIISLISYIIMNAIGLGPVPVLMLGELFPTGIKGPAMCTMGIYYAMISAVVTKGYTILGTTYGSYLPFFIFAACCWFGIIFIIKVVPETRKKSLQEIQNILGISSRQN